MPNFTPLKTKINNRDSIVKLHKKDNELFIKIIRRDGIILADDEYVYENTPNRTITYYYSGYVIQINLICGKIKSTEIDTYTPYRFNQHTNSELKKLNLA